MAKKHLLTRVSLTGADDKVTLSELKILSGMHPYAELALLYLPGKEGQARNPSKAWRDAFFDAQLPCFTAVHLCGSAVVELVNNTLPDDIKRADRLQLNINARGIVCSDAEILDIYAAAMELGPELILQYHEGSSSAIQAWLPTLNDADRARVHVLMDDSKGRGKLTENWYRPNELKSQLTGFAGGINPENVESVIKQLEKMRKPYWIDMESGVRTHNEFDLLKASDVLRAASNHLDWKSYTYSDIEIPNNSVFAIPF